MVKKRILYKCLYVVRVKKLNPIIQFHNAFNRVYGELYSLIEFINTGIKELTKQIKIQISLTIIIK